ncbi:MAG: hypothetical protein H6662_03600 [Ardenticatenaceae bacterium]|nr:hypothetical protein [Ardenticatenaceae bacterium]MCB9002937.1 hypothetical protein [Ardenticatenaceae bacterium]
MKKYSKLGILSAIILLIAFTSCQNQDIEQLENNNQTQPFVPTNTSDATSIITDSKTEEPTQMVSPPARIFYAMAYDPHRKRVVLFGGRTENGDVNSTWEYDGLTWKEMQPLQSPPPSSLIAMAYDPKRKVTVLYIPLGDHAGETWEYDGQTWHYIDMSMPPQIYEQSAMAYDPQRESIVLFGGQYTIDTWQYVDQVWLPLNVHAPVSFRMLDVSMDFDFYRERLVLQPLINVTPVTLELPSSGDWQIAVDGNETKTFPEKRAFVSIAYDSQRQVTVLFGGDETQYTWEYDGYSWKRASPIDSPSARYGHSIVYDEDRGVIVMFGGSNPENLLLNDTWEYDGTTWAQR